MPHNRLYIIVRNDMIDKSSMAAQAGHAVAQFMIEQTGWDNEYLILLQATKKDFKKLEHHLIKKNINYSSFREPDLKNRKTALAVLNNKELFYHLDLL